MGVVAELALPCFVTAQSLLNHGPRKTNCFQFLGLLYSHCGLSVGCPVLVLSCSCVLTQRTE
jgi:hypothetical protein